MATGYKFTRNYDHPINSYTDKAYRAGQTLLIPEAHADGADAAKAGERLAKEQVRDFAGQQDESPDAERG